jgi:crotonobetaine/carnitine-CoA ligase
VTGPGSAAIAESRSLPHLLRRAVATDPDHPMLVTNEVEISYGEFDAATNQVARFWRARGVAAGDRVVVMMDNRPEFLLAWFGLAKLGAVLVAANPRFQEAETGYLVRHSGARIAIADPEHLEILRNVLALENVLQDVVCSAPDAGADSLMDALEQYPDTPVEDVATEESLLSLIYTSGTTGPPKGVMHTHRTFVLTGEAYASWLRVTSADRAYVCLPLAHVNAQAYSVMGMMAAGATIVLAPRFSARSFWPDVRRHRVTMFNFIGAMLMILAKSAPSEKDADHHVRVAYSGSVAGLSLERRRELERRYGLRLRTGFGMSETTFGFIEPYDGPIREASIGKVRGHPDPSISPSEAKVVREDGTPAAFGEAGELFLRNATMMRGYYGDPERTNAVLRDGWLQTGDIVSWDENGFFYFVDRKKDIIRRRGENVSSVEVERVLNAHPGVRQSAVIGVPSELMDEDILAFIDPVEGANVDADELWTWVSERLADFKVPRYIEFTDSLPRTSTQKIAKPDLRSLASKPGGKRFDYESRRLERQVQQRVSGGGRRER